MGAMLIALGMVASLLSSNVTVAFILGALFCAVPIFLDWVGSPTLEFFLRNSGLRLPRLEADWGRASPRPAAAVGRLVEGWSVPARFQDFGSGVITLSGLLYFLGVAAAMLYLNMVLLGRRHWAGGEASGGRWLHSVVRFGVADPGPVQPDLLIDRLELPPRLDASAREAHTLSRESLELVNQIPADRPGPDPGLLQPGGPARVRRDQGQPARPAPRVRGAERRPDPAQPRADRARTPTRRATPRSGSASSRARSSRPTRRGRWRSTSILGVAFTSGLEEVVIPFFDRGLPVEYELTRSIRVVSRSGRKKVGILTTCGETPPHQVRSRDGA